MGSCLDTLSLPPWNAHFGNLRTNNQGSSTQLKARLPSSLDHQAIVPLQLNFFSTTCMVIRPFLPNVIALNLPGPLTAIIFSIATDQRLLYTISMMALRFPSLQKLEAFPTGRLIANLSSSMVYIHLYSSKSKIISNSYCYM